GRHRWREPDRGGRRAPPRQPVSPPAGSARKPPALLAEPPIALLPVLRALHRADVAAPARRRGSRLPALRARDRARDATAARARAPPLPGGRDVPPPPGRRRRQHAPRGILHRQALRAGIRERAPWPRRAALVRDAAARAHEHRAATPRPRAHRVVLGRAIR